MNSIDNDLRRLFGTSVEVAVWNGSSDPGLFEEEAASIKRAVATRRLEFARGRATARDALSALGVEPQAITVGAAREPIWPRGYVGSITHCEGLVAAAVARSCELATIGLDAEPARPLPSEARDLVLHPSERSTNPSLETVVFSAKESIYKALFPLTGRWMDFLDVEVTLDTVNGSFSAISSLGARGSPPELSLLCGRFVQASGLILTGCSLLPATPTPASPPPP